MASVRRRVWASPLASTANKTPGQQTNRGSDELLPVFTPCSKNAHSVFVMVKRVIRFPTIRGGA